jgi:hypothetical protein
VSSRPPESVAIDLPDGRTLDASIQPQTTAESIDVTVIEEIQPRIFGSCPICDAPATDDEHVPPESLGGRKMTRTCKPCNNDLGSRVEADLTDWFENALTLPRFSSDDVQGARRSGRILWRTTPEGEFVLLVDGKIDPAILDMLRTGQVDLAGLMPDRNRYRLALLKHSYLVACMRFGTLVGDVADEIRRDLIAARDAPSREEVPVSRLALGLTVVRFVAPWPGVTAPAIRAIIHEDSGPCEGVILAGQVFVSWSSLIGAIAPAATPRQLRVSLMVGGTMDGTISAVDAACLPLSGDE